MKAMRRPVFISFLNVLSVKLAGTLFQSTGIWTYLTSTWLLMLEPTLEVLSSEKFVLLHVGLYGPLEMQSFLTMVRLVSTFGKEYLKKSLALCALRPMQEDRHLSQCGEIVTFLWSCSFCFGPGCLVLFFFFSFVYFVQSILSFNRKSKNIGRGAYCFGQKKYFCPNFGKPWFLVAIILIWQVLKPNQAGP